MKKPRTSPAATPRGRARGATSVLLDAHRGNLLAEACPSREVLKHVTSRWGVLVFVALRDGPRRFAALRRRIGGVSDKMLAQTLRTLADDGFVARTVHDDTPVRVEYALTPLGESLAERLVALTDWIEEHVAEVPSLASTG